MTHVTIEREALQAVLVALASEEYRLRQTGQSQVYPGIGFAITVCQQALAAPAPVQEPTQGYQPIKPMSIYDAFHMGIDAAEAADGITEKGQQ